jgi:ABC-type transport system involved in multi-copper enzyme maturation permease subunit
VRATRIGERRFSLEVAAGAPLEPLIAELVAAGARLISVTPLGATLEDVFLRVVEPAQGAGGLHTVEAPGSVRASDSGPAGADGGRQIRSGAVVSPKAGGVGRRILLVARHVFKESVRDRAFYAIAVFAGLVVAFSLVVGQLSAGQEVKIVKDVGLAAIEIAGALMAALTGVGLVAREIERRSIVSLLAKPLARWEFVVGKYLGLLVTILVNVAGMAGALYAVLAWLHGQATPLERAAWDAPALDATLALAVVMVAAEIGLLTAVALFFSSFSSSAVMSVTFTTGVFVAGLLRSDIRGLAGATDVSPVVAGTASTVGWFLPAFDAFDIKSEVVHGLSVPSGYVPLTLIYAALYAAALVVGAVLVFSRRDFK